MEVCFIKDKEYLKNDDLVDKEKDKTNEKSSNYKVVKVEDLSPTPLDIKLDEGKNQNHIEDNKQKIQNKSEY